MVNSQIEASLNRIRLAQKGDKQALGDLFVRYYNPVCSFVRRRLGKELRLNLESGDIMQETFLVALDNFDKFELRHEAGIIHWLSTIAEHRIRGQARRAHAQKRDRRRERALRFLRESISGGSIHLEPAAEITWPGDAAERNEEKEKLHAAIDELEPGYREVIMHRTYSEASWIQIAELMGKKSEAAARQLHARAIVELAARMGAPHRDPGASA